MARKVSSGQPSAPPYLLIIFVILFLFALVGNVVLYLQIQDYRELADEAEQRLDLFANRDQLASPEVVKKLETARDDGDTVVRQYRNDISDLVAFITGNPSMTVEAAKTVAANAQAATGSREGLAQQVQLSVDQQQGLAQQVKDLKNTVQERNRVIAERDEAIAGLKQEIEQQAERQATQIADRDEKLKQQYDAYNRGLQAVQAEYKERIENLNAKISDQLSRITDLEGQVIRLSNTVDEKEEMIAQMKGETGEAAMTREPSGKVIQVFEEEGLCYINAGSRNGVEPGMTFSVYPADEFGDEEAKKASLLVMSTKPTISVCRMVMEEDADPVTTGDLVWNIAFQPGRNLMFAVVGEFDLAAGRAATAGGAQAVKEMIRQMGNKVQNTPTMRTDYVVLGKQPNLPAEPPEDAPAIERRVWQEQKNVYDQYKQAIANAKTWEIPVLNQNRFLDIIGYEAMRLQNQK